MSTPTLSMSLLLAALLPAQTGWSVPMPESALNSTAADSGPHLSADGLTLHFASFRSGNWEIYSSTRAAVGAAWSPPVQEVALGDPVGTEDQPFLTFTGLEVWFSSTRAGGASGADLMFSTRTSSNAPWSTPVFASTVNGSGAESAPSLTADGLELYFLTTSWGAPYAPQNSIYRATRSTLAVPFGPPTVVSELLSPNTHRDVEISPDGLTLLYTEFFSPRTRVMQAERPNRSAPFAAPVALTEFDTVGTSIGVYSFTRSLLGDEAFLAAGFSAAAGGQEILHTQFDGLTHFGAAGNGSTMNLHWRDSGRPGAVYALGAAMGNTGFALGARHVPLDADWLLAGTLGQSVPPFTGGWGGVLDGNGEANASLTNVLPALVGLQFHVGAFTWDNASPFGVGTIGNSCLVQFQ